MRKIQDRRKPPTTIQKVACDTKVEMSGQTQSVAVNKNGMYGGRVGTIRDRNGLPMLGLVLRRSCFSLERNKEENIDFSQTYIVKNLQT